MIARAESGDPQPITRKGRTAAVVVSATEWERKTKRAANPAKFFAASRLRGAGVTVEHLEDGGLP